MSGIDKTRDELFAEYFEDREGSAQVAEHAYRQGWKDRATYTVVPTSPTQPADARPVAIYQIEQAPKRWTDVSRETYEAWAFGKQIVYATRDTAPSDAIPEGCTPADAQTLRLANHGLAQEIDRYRVALSDLCLQIHTFAEKYGEADFETGRAERLLQSADAKSVSFLTDHERIELYELRDAVEHATGAAMMSKSSIPVGWKLLERRTHFELIHEGCVIASLAGPHSEENAAIIARAIAAIAPRNET